jgi:general secretion pathway protein G
MKRNIRSRRAAHSGFTLAEMMVVIVIIGLLATLVVPNVIQKIAVAFGGKAKSDIIAIESALKEYAIQNGGKYPDSLEVLVTPDANGHTYLEGKKLPKDPWHNEYMYDPPSPGHPEPRIYSYGKDGQPGGEGDDADISNETIRENG